MAKSSRASSRKANNQRLKAKVFGPVEAERNARLSAKLLELAAAPKADDGDSMKIVVDAQDPSNSATADKEEGTAAATAAADDETAMDVDAAKTATASKKSSSKKGGRIEKRRKTSKIVFPKYGDKTKKKRKH